MPYIADQNAPKYGGKNQGKIPFFTLINVLLIFFHLIFGFLKLVMISLPFVNFINYSSKPIWHMILGVF
jgi:hypothetical protein